MFDMEGRLQGLYGEDVGFVITVLQLQLGDGGAPHIGHREL